MRIYKLLLAAGLVAALTGCSRRTQFFSGAPLPAMTALTCELKAVHVGALNPNYERGKAGDVMSFTIAEMNDGDGRARLIGNQQTSVVKFERSETQLRFIEITPIGNMTTLSIFIPPDVSLPLPAVHSRHIQIAPGNIAISQYAGSCKPKL